jgi:hypothetical protein
MLPRNLDRYPQEIQIFERLKRSTSHPCRALIVRILFLKGETGFSVLKSIINIPSSTLSSHIKFLVRDGFLEFRSDRIFYYYTLSNIPLSILGYVMERSHSNFIEEEILLEEIDFPFSENLSLQNRQTVCSWIRIIGLNFQKTFKF